MSKETFIINYGVYFGDDKYESHTTKVKNCMSEMHSKIKLEHYVKNKYKDFKKLVVYKCNSDFSNIFGFDPFSFMK